MRHSARITLAAALAAGLAIAGQGAATAETVAAGSCAPYYDNVVAPTVAAVAEEGATITGRQGRETSTLRVRAGLDAGEETDSYWYDYGDGPRQGTRRTLVLGRYTYEKVPSAGAADPSSRWSRAVTSGWARAHHRPVPQWLRHTSELPPDAGLGAMSYRLDRSISTAWIIDPTCVRTDASHWRVSGPTVDGTSAVTVAVGADGRILTMADAGGRTILTVAYGPVTLPAPTSALSTDGWWRHTISQDWGPARDSLRRASFMMGAARIDSDPSGRTSIRRIQRAACASLVLPGSRSCTVTLSTRGGRWTITITDAAFGARIRFSVRERAAWDGDWAAAQITATVGGRQFRIA